MSIIEVAKAAGVSHATVSRVINNSPGVSAESVRLVNEAMRQIGYTPPARRRGPRRKNIGRLRTGNVAMLMLLEQVPTLVLAPVTAVLVHAAERALADHGVGLSLAQIKGGKLPSSIRPDRIDGLLLHGHPPIGELADQIRRFPAVWVLSRRTRTGDWGDRVSPDNEAIGRMAVEYLVAQGHDRLAMLNFNPTHLGFIQRREAFVHTAESMGVGVAVIQDRETTSVPLNHKQEMDPGRLEALIDELVRLKPLPTGLFVPRSRWCVPTYRALRARGIEPGKDVQIIACDLDPVLSGLDPRPATIDVRPEEIGARAVEQLLKRIKEPQDPVRHELLIEPELVLPHDAMFDA